jgi:hypothetical protein
MYDCGSDGHRSDWEEKMVGFFRTLARIEAYYMHLSEENGEKLGHRIRTPNLPNILIGK